MDWYRFKIDVLVLTTMVLLPLTLAAQDETKPDEPPHPLVGKPVTVIEWNTELKAGTDVVGYLQLGEVVRPSASRPGWLWIPGKEGWVREKALMSPDQAMAHFDQVIAAQPQAGAFRDRAVLRAATGQLEPAVQDFQEAINRGLTAADVYVGRGNALLELERYSEALRDFNAALQKNDKLVTAYELRGTTHLSLKRYAEAIRDYQQAVELAPEFATAWNNIGWIRATCPDGRFRDGPTAVNAAKKACDLTSFKDPYFLDTLAAAYAEVEEFEAAVKWAEQARRLLPEDERGEIEGRLALYKERKSFQDE